ncbi:zinc-finger of monoamine-oxidase A repressor R1, partial [Trifolium medium]|nr:zinc-finger of monoamine-oxidase A repressor R1 [Trifolium medium]
TSRLGYKSVAHYLIQTRRSDTDVEKNDDGPNPVSVKRSPLSDEDDKSHEVNETKLGFMQPIAETVAKRSLTCPDEQLVKLEKVEGLDPDKSLASSTKPSPNEQYQLVKLEKVEVLDTPISHLLLPSNQAQMSNSSL